MAKKTKEDVRHTSVLFTGTVKLLNSAFCISKSTKPISTKFIYFLPYIYTTSHIKFEGNLLRYLFLKIAQFSSHFSFYSPSHKITNVFKSCKITFQCFNFFQFWNTNNAHLGLYFPKILRYSTKKMRELYTTISQFFHNLLSHLPDASSMLWT